MPTQVFHRVLSRVAIVVALLVATALPAIVGVVPAQAQSTQLGQPSVVINPGGGVASDGADGVRVEVNRAGYWTGQDVVTWANTEQYCCTAVAPMLNVGGTLFGQAGPANASADWTSLSITDLTGTATTTGGSDTGSGSFTVTYVATKNSLEYRMDRAVSYTYPNNYFTDSYSFTIPAGNTEDVRFYQGGDAAPGSSDAGYGIMLTEPVRAAISLNPYSQILAGYREVAGDRPFDGATTQSYWAPYPTVASGGDIGFVADNNIHDAGLMVQWNLGSTPGVQTASMETFVGVQAVSLSARFGATAAEAATPVPLDISLLSTVLTDTTGLGYTITLPAGMVLGSAAPTNSCGGTLIAAAGSSTVTLSDAAVAAATNCVVTVEVAAATAGAYTITSASASGLVGVTNTVGTSTLTVTEPATTTPPVGSIAGGVGAFAPDLVADLVSLLDADDSLAAITVTPDGAGLWGVTATGAVLTSGSAADHGSLDGIALNAPIVGMAATDSGHGYYLVSSDGGVFAFGDATFAGSMGGQPLNFPVTGLTPACDGQPGYRLVASDGGVFAFGGASFEGSMGGTPLNKSMVGLVGDCTSSGYWTVAADGGVFAFGEAQFYGSLGGTDLASPVVGLLPTGTGSGYWLVDGQGQLSAFGDAV